MPYMPRPVRPREPTFGQTFKQALAGGLGQALVALPTKLAGGLIDQSLQPGGGLWEVATPPDQQAAYRTDRGLATDKAAAEIAQAQAMTAYYPALAEQARTTSDVARSMLPSDIGLRSAQILETRDRPTLAREQLEGQRFGVRSNLASEQSGQALRNLLDMRRLAWEREQWNVMQQQRGAGGARVPKLPTGAPKYVTDAQKEYASQVRQALNAGAVLDENGNVELQSVTSTAQRQAIAEARANVLSAVQDYQTSSPEAAGRYLTNVRDSYVSSNIPGVTAETPASPSLLFRSLSQGAQAPVGIRGGQSGARPESEPTTRGQRLRLDQAIAGAQIPQRPPPPGMPAATKNRLASVEAAAREEATKVKLWKESLGGRMMGGAGYMPQNIIDSMANLSGLLLEAQQLRLQYAEPGE